MPDEKTDAGSDRDLPRGESQLDVRDAYRSPLIAADDEVTRNQSQFSLRGMFALTAAFALWLFLLPDFRREPIAIAVYWTIAIVAGICGHLIYTYLFPWRGTVLTSLAVLSVVIFTSLAAMFGAGDDVINILIIPIDLFMQQRWPARIRTTVPVFACIAALAAAHPIKPGLISAILTSTGILMWYGLVAVIAASAG